MINLISHKKEETCKLLDSYIQNFKNYDNKLKGISEEWNNNIRLSFNSYYKNIARRLKRDKVEGSLVNESREELEKMRNELDKKNESLISIKQKQFSFCNNLYNDILSTYSKSIDEYHKEDFGCRISTDQLVHQNNGFSKNALSYFQKVKEKKSVETQKTIVKEDVTLNYSKEEDNQVTGRLKTNIINSFDITVEDESRMSVEDILAFNDNIIKECVSEEGYDSSKSVGIVRRDTELIYKEEGNQYFNSLVIENILSLEPEQSNYMNSSCVVMKRIIGHDFFTNQFECSLFSDSLVLFYYSFNLFSIFSLTDKEQMIKKSDILFLLQNKFLKVYPEFSFLCEIRKKLKDHLVSINNLDAFDANGLLKTFCEGLEYREILDTIDLFEDQTNYLLNSKWLEFILKIIKSDLGKVNQIVPFSRQKYKKTTYNTIFFLFNDLIRTNYIINTEGVLIKYKNNERFIKLINTFLDIVEDNLNKSNFKDSTIFHNWFDILIKENKDLDYSFCFTSAKMIYNAFVRQFFNQIYQPTGNLVDNLDIAFDIFNSLSSITDVSKETFLVIFSQHLYESKFNDFSFVNKKYDKVRDYLFNHALSSPATQELYNKNLLNKKIEDMKSSRYNLYLEKSKSTKIDLMSQLIFLNIFSMSLGKKKEDCIADVLSTVKQLGENSFREFTDKLSLSGTMNSIDRNIEYYLFYSEEMKEFFSEMIDRFSRDYLEDISEIITILQNNQQDKNTNNSVEQLFGMGEKEFEISNTVNRLAASSFMDGLFNNLVELFGTHDQMNNSRIKSIIPIVNIIADVRIRKQNLIVV